MPARVHWMTGKRIYRIWQNMKSRCRNPKVPNYKNYGGRGIKVCDEWQDSSKFIDWALKNGYRDDLYIDRIDNNGDYEPFNCKWSTRKEQANNKTNSHFITINGDIKTMAQWVDETGIKQATLEQRINKYKDTGDKIIRPARKMNQQLITINYITKTLTQWSEVTGIKYQNAMAQSKSIWINW